MMPKEMDKMTRKRVTGKDFGRAVGLSHLSWTFDPASTSSVVGDVVSRNVGPLRISWLTVRMTDGRWRGERTSADIAANPEPYLIVVMPLQAAIQLRADSSAITVASQELGVWDSTQTVAFELAGDVYEQISVLVPQRVLRARPTTCQALHCAHIGKENVLSELCVQHMLTLSKFLNAELRPYEISLSSVTTSLFDAVLASLYRAPRDRDVLLEEIKNYIECYITDETLSPTTIAAAFEISTRYAHKLFEHDGCSIGEWILSRRLDRSADDVLGGSEPITDIAFKWGFKDLGHYSRTFRQRFGMPPSSYRKQGYAP